MSLDWIRRYYGVPAKRGGRIEYMGGGESKFGTICGSSGPHLNVRLDGSKHTMPLHPTWNVRYLDGSSTAAPQNGRGSGEA